MSEHHVTLRWRRASSDFTLQTYNRDHVWDFGHSVEVPASASPEYKGNPDKPDPEQAFAAALSSCHMLTFLAIAARRKFTVDSYEDEARACMEKGADGKLAIGTVILRPRVAFAGETRPICA
jgi:organic hydroperoxide reductase OsmC/OhrA